MNKKIIYILLSFFMIIGISYALSDWKAGGGVKWIAEDATEQKTNRFTDFSADTSNYGTGYYLDTYTGLKWAAQDSGDNYKWSANTSYTEPTWNGTSYDYPTTEGQTGNALTDYPAFAYCSGIGTGWRLPIKREMFSIITDVKPDLMTYYTALYSIANNYYWSSTVYATTTTTSAWNGDFLNGHMYSTSKTWHAYLVLCIHD